MESRDNKEEEEEEEEIFFLSRKVLLVINVIIAQKKYEKTIICTAPFLFMGKIVFLYKNCIYRIQIQHHFVFNDYFQKK